MVQDKLKVKKLLIITERFYPEDFIINELAIDFQKKGFEISVLTQSPSYPHSKIFNGYKNRLFKKYDWQGIKIYRFFTVLGYKKKVMLKLLNYFSFMVMSIVTGIFIGRKFDKVFIFQTGPLLPAVAGVVIKKLYKKPLTIWTQDLWPDAVYDYGFKKNWFLKTFLNWLVKFVYKNCRNIFVSSRGFIKRISEYVPNKKIRYFPNWPMINCFFEGENPIKLSDKFNFTFAGGIGKFQNLENVVRGFGLFIGSGKDAQLNIIGEGANLNALKQLMETEKIPNIVFWQRQSASEIPKYISASDALIIPLIDSPMGRFIVPSKFQAYLTAQKPIFCIAKGETATIVRENNLGIVSDPCDIESIASGFEKMMEFAHSQTAFKSKAKDLLDREFSKEKIVNEMVDIVV